MKYRVDFTYTVDLDQSLRYDVFAKRFISLVSNGIYVTLDGPIYTKSAEFLAAIEELMADFAADQPDGPGEGMPAFAFDNTTFDIRVRELYGANEFVNSVTVNKDYLADDSEEIYSGALEDITEIVAP